MLNGDMRCAVRCVAVLALWVAAGAIAGQTMRGEVRAAFTPDCDNLLLDCLGKADTQVRAAVYTLTRREIVDKLVALERRGVDVQLKVDAEQAGHSYMSSELKRLRRHGIRVMRITTPEDEYSISMHHKFAVIDGRIVVTGSYNWTTYASEKNWENLVAIESRPVAREYLKQWQTIRSRDVPAATGPACAE